MSVKKSTKKTLKSSTQTAKKTPTVKKSASKAAATKKTATVKKVVRKQTKKAAVKKTAVKKTAVKKAATKKTATKKAAAKKAVQRATAAPKTAAAQTSAAKSSTTAEAAATKELLLNARKRKGTPAVFKTGSRKNSPIVFTIDDVREALKKKATTPATETDVITTPPPAVPQPATRKPVIDAEPPEPPRENRVLGAASIMDILGFNPADKAKSKQEDSNVPRKWQKFYRELVAMRDQVRDELDFHTRETLKRSNKDDSGDLSGYGQHMADAGTDTFDRDFALSLLSNEQEALYEINEAIQRILNNTYGICEITGEPIDKERLMAVPFTRYSLEGQRELEKSRKRSRPRTEAGVFSDNDDVVSFAGDDDSDS